MDKNTVVGKCKYCSEEIHKFQVVTHEGCAGGYQFHPDWLNFDRGVVAGRELEREAIRKEGLVPLGEG